MLSLKRRWSNLGLLSRLIVVISALAVISIVGLATYLLVQSSNSPKPATQANNKGTPIAPNTPESGFNFGLGAEGTPAQPPRNEAARLLMLANRFLAEGEPLDAAAQHRLILSNYPKSSEAVEAAFGLAQASAERGRWQEADSLFKKFLQDYPNDARRPLLLLRLAQAQKAQGFWDNAISYYQQYSQDKNGKLLEGYTYFDIADALDNSLRKDQAIEFYKKAGLSLNGSNQIRANALERVGNYYSESNPAQAVEWYSRILEVAKVPEYRASIMLKIAKAYLNAKQPEQATAIYYKVLEQYLETPAGLAAINALNSNPTALSEYYKGYAAFKSSNWDAAISSFSKALGRSDEKAAPNTAPALPANLTPAEQDKYSQAWFWLGRAYEAKNDINRAAAEYRELQIRLPKTDIAQDALWRTAQILRNAGQTEAAIAQFNYIVVSYPTGKYAEQAWYNQADSILSRSGPEAALSIVNAFADKFPDSNLRNEVLYDTYRAFLAKGNQEAARVALQKAASSSGSDYYAIRAGEMLTGQNPLNIARSNPITHPTAYDPARFAQETANDRKPMETWLTGWAAPEFNPATPGASSPLDIAYQTLKDDKGLQRMAELKLLGRSTEADREAKESLERYSGKPLALYLLALSFNEQNQYAQSLMAAREVFSLFQTQKPGVGVRGVPLMLQKLLFPPVYQNLVLEQSRRNNVDPLLFLALMKQESAFDSNISSSAGARGLTQVMPETGRGIATNLDKPYYSPDDLFRPAVSIEFGAFYLSRRLQDFNGNPYAALAAYNGGAGNVPRWINSNPPERNFDAFVEGIDFYETRAYVKIIYASYAMYRQVYAAK